MAPASTEAVAPRKMPNCSPPGCVAIPPSETVSGITTGSMMAMVPHDVPVANAIAPAMKKTRTGISSSATRSERSCDRYCAVPISSVTAPSDQASVRMIMPIIIAFMPASQASMLSCIVKAFCPTEIAIATRQPASEPHSNVANGSASAMMSINEASPPALARPVV